MPVPIWFLLIPLGVLVLLTLLLLLLGLRKDGRDDGGDDVCKKTAAAPVPHRKAGSDTAAAVRYAATIARGG